MNRAYSLFEIKSIDGDARVIEGIATTPATDRVDDVVESEGAQFKLPIPLMWQHGTDAFVGKTAVGHVIAARPTKDGIPVRVQMARTDEPGRLKEILDFAWQTVQKRLVRAFSIGFRPLSDPEPIKGSYGLRFKTWEWLELSAVTIPANAEATITTVKAFDAPFLAASGNGSDAVASPSAGVSAPVRTTSARGRPAMKKTIQDQIKDFQSTREVKDTERKALMEKAGDSGETLDAADAEKYDALSAELKSIDAHLVRLSEMEETNRASAKAVVASTPEQGAAARVPGVVQVKDNLPPGIGMARVAIAKISARLEGCSVMDVVKERWPDHSALVRYFQKATVPAGLTTSAAWAGNLVDTTNLATEFVEFLRPQTIIGRIPGLKRVPFNIRVTGQTTGAVAGWVGQGKPKPVTSFSTNAQTLLYTKIAAIAVITEELARFSSPQAETLVRDELARAVIERMDVDFVDPAHAAVTNVNPASITNGVTPLTSAGASADNIRTDLQNLFEQFILNNIDPTSLVLIMPNTLALAASLMVNSLGQPEFPGLTMRGGTLHGIPVITSQYAANQSGSGNLVIALNAADIFLADDGQVTLDASREASIQMSDAPTNDASTGTGQSLVSMYQTNSIAIRAERYINWAKFRTTAVSFIDDANWGSIGSPS